jgi:orotate phosphoribosyltransferase
MAGSYFCPALLLLVPCVRSPALPLQKEQLVVTDVVVLIDREQGGEAHLKKNNLNLHAAFKLSAMLDILQKHNLVTDEVAQQVGACGFAGQWPGP